VPAAAKTSLEHTELTFAAMVEGLIRWFRNAANARGQALVLFDDPETVSNPALAVQLKELNEVIKNKPTMPLPAGFYLSKEMRQFETFAIPDEARPILGDPKCMALEVLDSILSDSFGMHLLESVVRVREEPVVKLQMMRSASRSSTEANAAVGPNAAKVLQKVEKKLAQQDKPVLRNESKNKHGVRKGSR